MATMAAMPDSTSSSLTNGAPISPTETTAVDGRPVNPLCEAHSIVEKATNDSRLVSSPPLQPRQRIVARLLPRPHISRPKKQRRSSVSRILWPAGKSASNMNTTKEHAAAEPPISLLEVINADNTKGRQALAPGWPNSRSSSSNPANFALTTMPSAGGDGHSDLSAFRTPVRSITSNLSKPPQLIRGKKRSNSDAGEISPIPRHRLERRRMRPMI